MGWNNKRKIVNCHIETVAKLLSDENQFTHKATQNKTKQKLNGKKGIWDKLAVRLRIYEYNL